MPSNPEILSNPVARRGEIPTLFRKGAVMSRTSTAATAPMATVFTELPADKSGIRPMRVNVPEAEITELRRRIEATRWPDRETVPDATQGVQLATTQALARYWATEYDWRKVEAKLNALPQFITQI